MTSESAIAPLAGIETTIHFIREKRVMLDFDLARIYGVTTKRLKEQFKRNRGRFPEDFAFRLTRQELANLRSHFATSSLSSLHGGHRYLPLAFTEHGAIMLASVLNSPVAVEASVRVIRAFVCLREQVAANHELAKKFSELEKRLDNHDQAIATLFEAIRQLLELPADPSRREIGFHVKEGARPYRVRTTRSSYSWDRWMGDIFFPLTPSLGEVSVYRGGSARASRAVFGALAEHTFRSARAPTGAAEAAALPDARHILGERENGGPALGHTRDGFGQATVRKTGAWRRLFPLPEGEGQGEGKQQLDSHKMPHSQGISQ